MTTDVVLSGALCSGKTTLATQLSHADAMELVSVRAVLREMSPTHLDSRADLQEFGMLLEAQTDGSWLGRYVRQAYSDAERARLVIDSVRTTKQLVGLMAVLGSYATHIHLCAHETERARRFGARFERDLAEAPNFEKATAGEDETEELALAALADLVVDTTGLTADEVASRARLILGDRVADT